MRAHPWNRYPPHEWRICTLVIVCVGQLACASPEVAHRHHVLPTDPQQSLRLAASTGDVELAKLALDAGAQLNASDNFGTTALMSAAQGQHQRLVKLLLDRGSDPNIGDAEGHTALWHARRLVLDGRVPLTKGHHFTLFLPLPRFLQTDTAELLERAMKSKPTAARTRGA
jgi:hypothetical protein